MNWQPVNLGLRSNPERVFDDGAARFVNCYPEEAGDEGRFRYPVYACDGFTAFSTVTPGGPARGMFNLEDTTLLVVSGTRVASINTSGTSTDLFHTPSVKQHTLAQNRKDPNAQVAIVSEDGQFLIYEGGTVTDVALVADIPKSSFTSVVGIDGYFMLTASNGEIWKTELNEGATIDTLDFATTAANPDGLLRGVMRGREYIPMGPRSMEFWTNTGAADFPFERSNSANIGLYAGPTAVPLTAVIDGMTTETVAWVATNTYGDMIGVMIMAGYDGRKVSPSFLDRLIRDADKTTLKAFSHTRGGVTFYTLTSATWTWEMNCRTLSWHQRKSTGLDVWRVSDAATFNGQTVYGDYAAGSLYQASPTVASASQAALTMRQSLTGGRTWNETRSKTVGNFTDTRKKVQFNRLGQAKEAGRVIELTLTNAIVENGVDTDMVVVPPALHAWPSRTRLHMLRVIAGRTDDGAAKGILAAAMVADGQEA